MTQGLCNADGNGTFFSWPHAEIQIVLGATATNTTASQSSSSSSNPSAAPTSDSSNTVQAQQNCDTTAGSVTKPLAVGLGVGLPLLLLLTVLAVFCRRQQLRIQQNRVLTTIYRQQADMKSGSDWSHEHQLQHKPPLELHGIPVTVELPGHQSR
jgi:hypothetical protein